MPMLIRTIDEIMGEAKRDMLFVRFGSPPFFRSRKSRKARRKHLDWFDAKGLTYELAAPRGWLDGDPDCFAVHFDGLEDPRIAAYSAAFENAEGKSRDPDAYRMVIISYRDWLDESEQERLRPD
jgi:hypothetical protein